MLPRPYSRNPVPPRSKPRPLRLCTPPPRSRPTLPHLLLRTLLLRSRTFRRQRNRRRDSSRTGFRRAVGRSAARPVRSRPCVEPRSARGQARPGHRAGRSSGRAPSTLVRAAESDGAAVYELASRLAEGRTMPANRPWRPSCSRRRRRPASRRRSSGSATCTRRASGWRETSDSRGACTSRRQ